MMAKAKESNEDEAITKAEKVIETARVYKYYEKFLRDEKLLDFGDLVYRAVQTFARKCRCKNAKFAPGTTRFW